MDDWSDKDIGFSPESSKPQDSNTNATDVTNNANIVMMRLELTDELRHQEIVYSYIFDTEIDSLSIELNHKYGKKKIKFLEIDE